MVDARANPEKRLFISLITRDIGLVDAIIDLTDNSVNAAMKVLKNQFSSVKDFQRLLAQSIHAAKVEINISINSNSVIVSDNASGIDFQSARDETFRFGHSANHNLSKDRLSVYGIGMKRALFKIGKRIEIISDSKKGGFSLNLDVPKWAREDQSPWVLPIDRRSPTNKTGTVIKITQLHDEISNRITDGKFEDDLKEKLSKVYSFFLGRLVKINVNQKPVDATQFELGKNFSHQKFKSNGVDCSITAGISKVPGDRYVMENAGWYVFCNFRTVVYADKTPLTGWGAILPQFQPKHRPFIGLVSFTSRDPELLPWTTTKGTINEDSPIWQEAKARMISVGRPIVRFLDKRYTGDGTEIQPNELSVLSGSKENAFQVAANSNRYFKAPKKKEAKLVSVQYSVKPRELNRIRQHFSRSNMSASEIGRTTFDYFLENEVG